MASFKPGDIVSKAQLANSLMNTDYPTIKDLAGFVHKRVNDYLFAILSGHPREGSLPSTIRAAIADWADKNKGG
jgi:hypothetical protein